MRSGVIVAIALALMLSASGPPPHVAATPPPPITTQAAPRRGINIAGAEFGDAMPGRLDQDYTYPTAAEIAGYAAMGFDLIRIPVRWERLRTAPAGAFRAADLAALDRAVGAGRRHGMIVVIDLHNYARWSPGPDVAAARPIDQGPATTADLVAVWRAIGGRYPQAGVWLGLMNEPHDIAPAAWWRIAGTLVTQLRRAGVRNRLLVPGTAWTGAHSWLTSGNAREAARLRDPLNDILFEVHQYLDGGSSGASGVCERGSATRLDAALAWARANKARLFVGEMAAGPGDACRAAYRAMIRRIESSGVVAAWAAWGGGRWFSPTDPFALPADGKGAHYQHLQPFLATRRAN